MGKRNQARSKKQKSNIKKVVPGIQDFLLSKENYVHELKSIFSRFLCDFNTFTETRIESQTCVPIKCNQSHSICFEKRNCCVQDPCDEFSHIFRLQLKKFLNSILIIIKEVHTNHPNLFKVTISDSFEIIEKILNEVSKVNSCYNIELKNDIRNFSLELYKGMLLNDNSFSEEIKSWKENIEAETSCSSDSKSSSNGDLEVNNANSSSGKKSKKKRRRERNKVDLASDVVLDLEIEEFKNKLDIQIGVFDKVKPNITEDWIAGLRKRIKERIL
ncbi:hypothetical protein SteCoe_3362 [Stentor coeruleus]|uniref:Uncharacterized protein n=1 Tax=Stentor coeruleus TaxID=5963 RepID=A0A1R2CXG3_9CILI|nr:hypothetical protein SteCoe_3362 [Stentor coeruleus]